MLSMGIPNALLSQLPVLRQALAETRAAIKESEALASDLAALIAKLERIPSDGQPINARNARVDTVAVTEPDTDHMQPSGIDAMRIVIRENPERQWNARSLHDRLAQRGWISTNSKNPFHVTQNNLARLYALGEVEKVGRGAYQLTREIDPPSLTGALIGDADPLPVQIAAGVRPYGGGPVPED